MGGLLRRSFSSRAPSRIYGAADLALAEELARRAALSIDNARLFLEAQRAIKTREDILVIVSHDLKNPVTAISLTAHLMRQYERMEKNQIIGVADKIQRAMDKMLRLICRSSRFLQNSERIFFGRASCGNIGKDHRAHD